jgi:hypothetical protein
MGTSSGFKNTNYYEAERINVTVTHSDFAKDADFENLDKSDDLVDYLLSKDYDKFFKIAKNGQVTVDTVIINKLFDECYEHFNKSIDSVQVFHIITDFYRIEPSHMFEKLVKRPRMLLLRDLRNRTNITGLQSSKLGKNAVQKSFIVKIVDQQHQSNA